MQTFHCMPCHIRRYFLLVENAFCFFPYMLFCGIPALDIDKESKGNCMKNISRRSKLNKNRFINTNLMKKPLSLYIVCIWRCAILWLRDNRSVIFKAFKGLSIFTRKFICLMKLLCQASFNERKKGNLMLWNHLDLYIVPVTLQVRSFSPAPG